MFYICPIVFTASFQVPIQNGINLAVLSFNVLMSVCCSTCCICHQPTLFSYHAEGELLLPSIVEDLHAHISTNVRPTWLNKE